MKSIFVFSTTLTISGIHFQKKNEEQKKASFEAQKRLMVRFTLRFTSFELYSYRKRF